MKGIYFKSYRVKKVKTQNKKRKIKSMWKWAAEIKWNTSKEGS